MSGSQASDKMAATATGTGSASDESRSDGEGDGTTSAATASERGQQQQQQQQQQQPTMCLTSDEVNYLIFRYLQESGFVHSSFTFVYESMLGRSNIRNADRSIPPGALISFLQKGLQYVGIEESLHRETGGPKGGDGLLLSSVSLLSPQTISALTRETPPIQLHVPPATAAAAVRARLEAEAKIEAERKALKVQEAAELQALANGTRKFTGPGSLPPQATLQDPHTLARNAIANANQTLLNTNHHHHNHPHPLHTHLDSAGAAALLAQQRRELSVQMAVLQEEQIQQQFQLQHQLQHEHQLQQQLQQSEAAAVLASVAGRLSGTKRSATASASATTTGSKKGPKKGKSSSTPQRPTPPPPADDTGAESQQQQPQRRAADTGFTSLGEAVARLEASNSNNNTASSAADDEMMERSPSSSYQNQQVSPMEMMAENDEPAVSAPARPAHSPGDMEEMNGSHHRATTGDSSSSTVNGINEQGRDDDGDDDNAQENNQHPHRKEGGPSKGPDAQIDKEDELTNARPEEVLELDMHSSEVFMCAWNPIFTDYIATGSGDASARIWQMGGEKAVDGLGPVRLLPHGVGPKETKNKDVTTLEWSSDGHLLATGSYDGVARVWSRDGALVHTLRGHNGPIFSLKWNRKGNYLLSGSYDQTTIVWNVSGSTGVVEQQFDDHDAPALDVDWKDDTTFASCSTDKTVHICQVGTPKPLKVYTGHTDEVNAVKWDPSGKLLASCSDDCTAKVWDVESSRTDPMHDFKLHQQEIYTVKWSPTGPGSRNPDKQPMLATASFDGSVRLWNINDGSCIQVFSRHRDSVYSVAFSPSGCFLASGSLAGQMYIWNVQEGKHVKSFKGKGDIFEVAWNKEESRVAACFSSNVVCIIDFKKPALALANSTDMLT